MKKFKLTKNSKVINGTTFYQIQALKDFSNVKKGDLGGWIEKEKNLSQDNNAQVYGDAWVFEDAQVYGDARVSDNAQVYGDARVYESAWVYGDARVYGNAKVSGNARVSGDAWVSGNAKVYENAQVWGNAQVYGNARVSRNAQVYGNARVYESAWVSGNARVYESAWVSGDARVSDNAQVSGDAKVYGDAKVSGNAHIKYSTLIILIITFKEPEYILASLNAVAINGKYTLYKRVNKVNDGKYISVYDKDFKYTTGKISTEKECDLNVLNSCSSGIHLSHPTYWNEGDTLIACEVKVEDIITCQQGKVRVKKCKVLGEVNI